MIFETRRIGTTDLSYKPSDFPKLNEPDSGATIGSDTCTFEGQSIAVVKVGILDQTFEIELFGIKCGYYFLNMKSYRGPYYKGSLCKTIAQAKTEASPFGWQVSECTPEERIAYENAWKSLCDALAARTTEDDTNFKKQLKSADAMAKDWGQASAEP